MVPEITPVEELMGSPVGRFEAAKPVASGSELVTATDDTTSPSLLVWLPGPVSGTLSGGSKVNGNDVVVEPLGWVTETARGLVPYRSAAGTVTTIWEMVILLGVRVAGPKFTTEPDTKPAPV